MERLRLDGIPAGLDLAPLLDCPNLKDLTVPAMPKNLESLRHHPSLQRLSEKAVGNGPPTQTTAEFWKEYDAKQAAGKK